MLALKPPGTHYKHLDAMMAFKKKISGMLVLMPLSAIGKPAGKKKKASIQASLDRLLKRCGIKRHMQKYI